MMALPCGHRVLVGRDSPEALAEFERGVCPGCAVPLKPGESASRLVKFMACPCCGTKWTKSDGELTEYVVL